MPRERSDIAENDFLLSNNGVQRSSNTKKTIATENQIQSSDRTDNFMFIQLFPTLNMRG